MTSNPQSRRSPDLSYRDVFRYRKIRGVNLGSWFTLERWIVDEPFKRAVPPQQSDLDVAKGADAKQILERHWDTWMLDEDWKWIAERGINTVRIPIGYYHLSGPVPNVVEGTDFAPYGNVYAGAWDRIKRAISTSGKFGLGVLIDLHAAAGGQNRDAHSGTSSGQIHFWDTKENLQSTLVALQFLARYLAPIQHCVGLELLNEPANNNQVQQWYESTLSALRKEPGCADFPLYIADAWDLNWYSKFVGDRSDFVIVDHHLYRCFTEDDYKLSGEEHAALIKTETRRILTENSTKAQGNIIVGEWSAGLHERSLRSTESGEQDRQRRVFVQAQLECYEATTAGWFWWTYKKGQGWDAGWSMKDAMTAEILPNWVGRRRPAVPVVWDEEQRTESMKAAFAQHTTYWKGQGTQAEPGRFEAGYTSGWTDAWMFMSFPYGPALSELGFVTEWMGRRKRENIAQVGDSAQSWEFDPGFTQGYAAAIKSFKI